MNKKIILASFVIIVLLVGFFLFFQKNKNSSPQLENIEQEENSMTLDESPEIESPKNKDTNWMNSEIKDVKTGETYILSDFDKPILLESFAVWCPICKKQQDEIKELIKEGDVSVHISINTDPNEDEEKVLSHVNKYSYDWIFAVFPASATKSLVDEFGINVINAPSAPIVLVCPDKSSRLLKSGVKKSSELKAEIEKCQV